MSLPAYMKQESKYHKLLKQLIDKLDLSLQEKERVEKELEIVHYSCSSKHVYGLYLLTQKCRNDKQYYVLRGTGSDTLLFYVLGISNINPCSEIFKRPLPYQIAIGTLENPRRISDEIQVSPSYRNKLHKYMEECFSKDSDFYKIIVLNNDKFVYNKYNTVLIPKGSDPYMYGDYIEAYGKSGFLSCFRGRDNSTDLNIIGLFEMPDVDLMYKDISSKEFNIRYIEFLKMIKSRKKIKDRFFVFKERYSKLDKNRFEIYKSSFIEFCLDICRQINLDKGMTRELIRCREDIWNVGDKLNLSEDDKYDLYKKVYFGRFHRLEYDSEIKSKYKNKQNQITRELYDAKLVFPLVHVIGFIKQDIDSL